MDAAKGLGRALFQNEEACDGDLCGAGRCRKLTRVVWIGLSLDFNFATSSGPFQRGLFAKGYKRKLLGRMRDQFQEAKVEVLRIWLPQESLCNEVVSLMRNRVLCGQLLKCLLQMFVVLCEARAYAESYASFA